VQVLCASLLPFGNSDYVRRLVKGTFSSSSLELDLDFDLDSGSMNRHAKYIGQRSFS